MYAKEVVHQIILFLNHHFPNMVSEDLFDLRLIMSELLYNAIIHGNKSDHLKQVHVNINLCENNIYAKISDEGNGFNPNIVLGMGCIQSSESFESSENGRGIRLVEALTDCIRFVDRGNVVEIHKRVKLNE